MSARVLIVDDLFPNVRLLETKLGLEYFDTLAAMNGRDAIAICEKGLCDLVLLDVMMPGMDGFEVCRHLKNNPLTAHIPVVMVTALDQPADRLRGLDAGADDFLTKPVDDTALFSRVRSLVRLKAVTDELRQRALASREFGIGDPLALATAETGLDARILLIEDRPGSAERLAGALRQHHVVTVEPDPQAALHLAAEAPFDLALVSLDLAGFDGLRLCSQLRSLDRTRTMPLIMLAEEHDRARVVRGLDFGVHDFLMRPVDRNELMARVRTQVKRKRFTEALRGAMQASLQMAVIDALTGLHNRRYLDNHLGTLFGDEAARRAQLSVLILDIDHFKGINDSFGHEAGDEVLRGFAERVRQHTRPIDIVARYGGEEVVVILPEAGLGEAQGIAERIRERVEAVPFSVLGATRTVPVTVSIGVAVRRGEDLCAADMLRRADLALYRAKAAGRNRVESQAA
ncbi:MULTISPECIES: PleD family two-component system response regulator [Methylobacterium]|jgi:two-component system cell cycle response regulator|uniref:diguanylate cyclase n=6 Tax=Methylobacterium TaxID=407 RepID=A0AAE8HMZ8_9HYPH|nr:MULTISPECIES: PleD family two-component system response regulator [Methylobacterium]KOX60806.1 response regulator PleD [Streptomyces purpurogeneiscleroticus]MBR20883.1 PleD family two-component system response regulator [Leifsonia sp.]AIQ90024.1 Response regulator receiver modulated diguanylate cyclase [Methylobacterium oryzae CBMB20]APT30778.1 cellulose synthesis regulatory protein [Methylobacterium phyllosphaerae]AWV17781.1 PleD family two-component system response regulator [Methylobacte